MRLRAFRLTHRAQLLLDASPFRALTPVVDASCFLQHQAGFVPHGATWRSVRLRPPCLLLTERRPKLRSLQRRTTSLAGIGAHVTRTRWPWGGWDRRFSVRWGQDVGLAASPNAAGQKER